MNSDWSTSKINSTLYVSPVFSCVFCIKTRTLQNVPFLFLSVSWEFLHLHSELQGLRRLSLNDPLFMKSISDSYVLLLTSETEAGSQEAELKPDPGACMRIDRG